MNNLFEIIAWVVYLLGVAFVKQNNVGIAVFVVGIISFRLIMTSYKFKKFNKTVLDKTRREAYILRTICFISFAILGMFIVQESIDNIICKISACVVTISFVLSIIWNISYFIQKAFDKSVQKQVKKDKIEFEEKYDKDEFDGKLYVLTGLVEPVLIRKLSYIITDNRIGSSESFFNSVEAMLAYLKKNNYVVEESVGMHRGNAAALCFGVSKLLEKNSIDMTLFPELVYEQDNDKIKKRRQEAISTIVNDITVINNMLEKFDTKIVVFENKEKCYFGLFNSNQEEKIKDLYFD